MQAKRALIGSQFTPFSFVALEFYLQKVMLLAKAIEILKGRSVQNRNVLLLLCLSFILSTSNSLTCLPNNRSPVTLSFIYSVYKQLVNSSTRYLVYQIIVLLLLCLQLTLSTINLSTKQTLLYLLFFL